MTAAWRLDRDLARGQSRRSFVPATGYRWRALTPDQMAAIRVAYLSGVSAPTLAREYGVSWRTIYRAVKHAQAETRWLEWGAWRAQFEMTPDGPVQVTGWLPR